MTEQQLHDAALLCAYETLRENACIINADNDRFPDEFIAAFNRSYSQLAEKNNQ